MKACGRLSLLIASILAVGCGSGAPDGTLEVDHTVHEFKPDDRGANEAVFLLTNRGRTPVRLT